MKKPSYMTDEDGAAYVSNKEKIDNILEKDCKGLYIFLACAFFFIVFSLFTNLYGTVGLLSLPIAIGPIAWIFTRLHAAGHMISQNIEILKKYE